MTPDEKTAREIAHLVYAENPRAPSVTRTMLAALQAARAEGFAAGKAEGKTEGFAEGVEKSASIAEQCNREGPYNAIMAAGRIRALLPSNDGTKQDMEKPPEPRCSKCGGEMLLFNRSRYRKPNVFRCMGTRCNGELPA